MSEVDQEVRKSQVDEWLAPVMFYLSLLFLVLVASILVLWIDVPRAVESYSSDTADPAAFVTVTLTLEEQAYEESAFRWGAFLAGGLLLIWPLFIAEQGFYLLRSGLGQDALARHPYWWLFCLIPPLRMCAHNRRAGDRLWLPQIGWQNVDRQLRRTLERQFSVPMVWIALLILPVLGLQFYFKERIIDYPHLRFALHVGTGLIWFAFAVEFIVMVSVAEKKFQYCKQHWLDLVIILLPLISFLRSLRLLRASRLLKIGKLQQLSRVVRVYRLRGVAMRAFRALMLLEVVHRLMRTKPEDRLRRLEGQYAEKQQELVELEEEIQELAARFSLSTEFTEAGRLDVGPAVDEPRHNA